MYCSSQCYGMHRSSRQQQQQQRWQRLAHSASPIPRTCFPNNNRRYSSSTSTPSVFSSSSRGKLYSHGAGSSHNFGHSSYLRSGSQPFSRPSHMQQMRTTSTTCSSSSSTGVPAAAAAAAANASKFAAPVVIIGGGPAGLAAALMLARRGFKNIKVFERLPEPPAPDDMSVWGNFEQASERLYMIGLNGRGQAVLRDLDVMDRIDTASSLVLGRLDWRPDTPPDKPILTRYTTRTYKTRCIQRDRLAACMLQEVLEKHAAAVSIEFGVRCTGVTWSRSASDQEVCQLALQRQDGSSSSGSSSSSSSSSGSSSSGSSGSSSSGSSSSSDTQQWIEESSFVIGADGAGSALRDAMEHSSSSSSSKTRLKVKRYKDTNVIVYRTIPMFWPKELAESRPGDLNYSVRTKSGVNFDCLPTKEGPFIGVMLYKPGDKQIAALKTKEDVRALFQRNFPAFLPAIREVDLERFAQKSDRNLPTFSYAGPSLHHGSSACLVGDAIHTVKPYFGQGVNSAFEDVKVLEKALDDTNDDPSRAVQRYSELRGKDAEALVVLSHSLDGGFLTFVGPLILDSILHKLLPQVFSPNIIASLQNEKWSFSQVRARKRFDRVMQVGLLAGILWVAVKVVRILVDLASKLLTSGGVA